jgi:hypothetical protein
MSVADLNSADFVGVDAPPCPTMQPGATWPVPLFVSHWGPPLGQGQVRWQLDFVDSLGERAVLQSGGIAIHPQRFSVSALDPLVCTLPDAYGLAILALWLEDEQGTIRCRNYTNALVGDEKLPASQQGDKGWVLRFDPAQWSRLSSQWPRVQIVAGDGKFTAAGSGWVEYDVPLPAEGMAGNVETLQLRFEAGARAGMAKVDWPQQINGSNYPQTETDRKHPSDLVVSINGIEIGQVHLPDDPADARGVLSHRRRVDPGSYGYLVDLQATPPLTAAILNGKRTLTLRFHIPDDAANRGGLSLYGQTMGCYPFNPTILLRS